jgi:hypothetical protein
LHYRAAALAESVEHFAAAALLRVGKIQHLEPRHRRRLIRAESVLRKYLIAPLSNLIGSDQLGIGDKVVVTHGNGKNLTFKRCAGAPVFPIIPPLKTEKMEPIPFVPYVYVDPEIRPDASKQPRN